MNDMPSRSVVPLMVPLSRAGRLPRAVVGGKARALGELMSRGYNVPDGYVISTSACARFAATGELPGEALMPVADGRPRAFRSSAVDEDGHEASFAGQYTSVLNVQTVDAARAALEQCWASQASAALAAYTGESSGGGGVAVIVQDMVDAECAGVAFSRNPVTGADEIVIDATSGLGDALLDGRVAPERWRVRRGGRPERVEGAGHVVLTSDQVERVVALCVSIESDFDALVDVEWAFAGGQLFVLQSRPITALPIEPSERPPSNQTWERVDSHFPQPIHPFLASAWLPIHADCIARAAERAGMPFDTIRSRVYGGRVYSRLEPFGDGGRGRDDRPPPPRWVFWLLFRLVPALRRRLQIAARALAEDLAMRLVDDWEREGRARIADRTRSLLDTDLGALHDAALADHLDAVLAHIREVGDAHFSLSLISTASTTGELGLLLEPLGYGIGDVLDLVQGHGASSVASGAALQELSATLLSDPAARRMLDEDPEQLRTLDNEAGDAFRHFLRTHGRRTYGGAIDQPLWDEDPAPLIRLVRAGVQGAPQRRDPRQAAAEAEERLRKSIGAGPQWDRIANALARARRARPYQDETEGSCFEAFGALRLAGRESGGRLATRGMLRANEDVWFLQVSEVVSALRSRVLDVDVPRRRAEHRWALANDLGRVLGPPVQPPPTFDFPAKSKPLLDAIFWTLLADLRAPAAPEQEGDLVGIGCSPGHVSGPVRIIESVDEISRVEAGDIVVCVCTTAAWSVVFPLVAGIITEVGGPLSHPATLAREFGVPGVVGVPAATTLLRDGERVRIDGARGIVWREG